ncbi:MAG: pectin acetylesterase-family hydrolase [Anaerolineae bacterium]
MTKRRIKLILAILGGAAVVGVLLLVAGYYLLTRTINVRDYATFADLPLYSWARVDLSDQTQCSDGSDYRIYTRRGESDNLIVHFVGGGACWDSDTCSKPISLPQLNGFYFSYIWDIFRATLDGIFQTSSADNPFHDWTSVYIPYCTADFHTGTTTQTYPLDNGGSVTVAYNGRQNVTEALDWVFATFDDPGTLLIPERARARSDRRSGRPISPGIMPRAMYITSPTARIFRATSGRRLSISDGKPISRPISATRQSEI